jgi:hypothetical protein
MGRRKQDRGLLSIMLKERGLRSRRLIYGIGHAVYSTSDPRTIVLRGQVEKLAAEKGLAEEMALYERVERLAPEIIGHERKMYKGVSANVDFYSGFLYRLLEIPPELFTPIFAMARIAGWTRTGWKNWPTAARSSGPPTRAWPRAGPTCRWRPVPAPEDPRPDRAA